MLDLNFTSQSLQEIFPYRITVALCRHKIIKNTRIQDHLLVYFPTHKLFLQFLLLRIFTLTIAVTSVGDTKTVCHSYSEFHRLELVFFLGRQRLESILVIALCLLDRLLALFIFIFQVFLKLFRSIQVLHTLRSYTLLCLVAVGLI